MGFELRRGESHLADDANAPIEDRHPYAHIDNLKKRRMLEALELSHGVVKAAATFARVSRMAHYNWINEDPEYKKAYEDICQLGLDRAESMLHKRMTTSDTLLIFYLKTKGKERGYVERHENLNVNHNLTVTVDEEEPPEDIPYQIDNEDTKPNN